jgi:hypothetical protein
VEEPLKGRIFEEVLDDGTAKPPPPPAAVRSLTDPAQRDRAGVIWFDCYRLECLISQWYEWLIQAPTSGRSDPTLAFGIANGVKDCVRSLCGLGLFKEPEAQVIEAFPDPDQAPIGTRWYLWPEGSEWMRQSLERLRALEPLREQLWGYIRTLETKPEALLIAGLPPLSVKPREGPRPQVTEPLAPAAPVGTKEDDADHEVAPRAPETEVPAVLPTNPPSTKAIDGQHTPTEATTDPAEQDAELIGDSPEGVKTILPQAQAPAASGAGDPESPVRNDPSATLAAPAGAMTKDQGLGAQETRSRRVRRRKGEATVLLAAAMESLAGKGDWGKTDEEIIATAGISRDSFYRLIRTDESIKRKLSDYRRQTLGPGPVRADDL